MFNSVCSGLTSAILNLLIARVVSINMVFVKKVNTKSRIVLFIPNMILSY